MKRRIRFLCSLMVCAVVLLCCVQPASAAIDFESLLISIKSRPEIVQFVSSQYSSVFAVLYDDGTVGVGGVASYDDDEHLQDVYEPVTKWKNVKKLYLNANTLIGLCKDGTVLSVGPKWDQNHVPLNTTKLKNVVDVAFMEPDTRYFFLLEDGTVEQISEGDKDYVSFEPFYGVYKKWKNVEKLIPYYYYDIFALFEDGSVESMAGDDVPKNWSNIRDLYVEGKFYGLKDDGNVVVYTPNPDVYPLLPSEAVCLAGAKELYSVGEVMFGLSNNGNLLVNGGKDWFFDTYGEDFHLSKSNWSKFTDITQLIASKGYGLEYVVALREDGKAVALNQDINKYLSCLPKMEKLAMCFAQDGTTYICGMEKDGNVVGVEITMSDSVVIHKDDFYGWNVDDLYATKSGYIVGFCDDGSFLTTYDSEENFLEYMPPVRGKK